MYWEGFYEDSKCLEYIKISQKQCFLKTSDTTTYIQPNSVIPLESIEKFILCKVVKHLTFSKDIQRYDKICGGSQWSFRDISALFKSLAKNCKKEVRRASTNSIRGTFTFPSQTMLILDIGLEGKFTFRFHTVVKSAVQSIKSKHQYFRFFWKKLSTSQF